jgi:unsaturated chondroitin disaccharide hydrolase
MPTDTIWRDAANTMLQRITSTAAGLQTEFPHWANAQTGVWTTTPGGDWTGGAWPGQLWLAYKLTGEERFHDLARAWCLRLRPRATLETAFKGFGFYCGAAIGDILAGDETGRMVALEAAASLKGQYDPALGLIPLGKDAEEHGEVGKAFSSIDSLQAIPLLYWAAERTGDASYRDVAIPHLTRVLEVHCQQDGSIIQSSELNSNDGSISRHFTHKGYSDTSIWGRAQAWGMLYSVMGFARDPAQKHWLEQSMHAADWWLANVPDDLIAFWDFSDPAIPNTERDTAGTAIVCAALLKLGELAPEPRRARYRDAAERTMRALVAGYLTPTAPGDTRPPGMLVGGCFNKRPDSRKHDSTLNAELIFGSYFMLECLLVLAGVLEADAI